jgi:sugar/nucleoside kinase (ribokinase family)
MSPTGPFQGVEYLIIGHLSADIQDGESRLGGTGAYSGATAAALGFSVGLVTSAGPDLDLSSLPNAVKVHSLEAKQSTSFENVYTETGRQQQLHARALDLDLESVPAAWRDPKIVHLAPIADEVDPDLARAFPEALVGMTPQGWMRRWNASGHVRMKEWEDVQANLPRAGIAVLSEEDVGGQHPWIKALARHYRLLVVTLGPRGARLFVDGKPTDVPAPAADEIDPTGAGDVFAPCFFYRYAETRDPIQSVRFANYLASRSVERVGLDSVPRDEEIQAALEQGSP